MNQKTQFLECKTYIQAKENTDKNLMPIAAKLKRLTNKEDYIPDPSYVKEVLFTTGEKTGSVCLVMSTVFTNPIYNGKWGWCYIPEDIRQEIAEYLYEYVGYEKWIFFCQKYINE